ncbi:MAG TPA: DUF6186 family protein [Jiangellaceae bacterium]
MSTRDVTIGGFIVLGVVTVTLVAASWAGRLPRFGEVVDLLMARRAWRVLVVLIWWWLGWHFLVRTS